MKLITVIATLFIAQLAFAGTTVDFRKDTVFGPQEQEILQHAIETQCNDMTSQGWPISERVTYINGDTESYAVVYYRSMFKVKGMDSDNYHPQDYTLVVNSIQKGGSQLEIQSVDCQ